MIILITCLAITLAAAAANAIIVLRINRSQKASMKAHSERMAAMRADTTARNLACAYSL
jgi:hypothetical protein